MKLNHDYITTILGGIVAAAVAIQPMLSEGKVDWSKIGIAAIIAGFGYFTNKAQNAPAQEEKKN